MTLYIEPPHRAYDCNKVASMIKTIRAGGNLPPILVHGEQAYSGSHRIDAWQRLKIEIDYVLLDDNEYKKIMEYLNLDPVYDTISDFEPFLDAAIELGFAGDTK